MRTTFKMFKLCIFILILIGVAALREQYIRSRVLLMTGTFNTKLVIGTRGSPLALAQAYETKRLLELKFPELRPEGSVIVKKVMTKGDSILNQALAEIGGKGLFTKELDEALLNKSVDLCVHSLKDVPTWLPEGTNIPCVLEREQTNDVFISLKGASSLASLAPGSVIGSASLRRQAQILAINPNLKVVNFRGNVQTRLKKLNAGAVDGTLLALAGLKRLNMDEIISTSKILTWEEMLPAVSQGAIAIQCRTDDSTTLRYLAELNHKATQVAVDCERAFLSSLDGNCRTPIAGQCKVVNESIVFEGLISKPDGKDMIRVSRIGSISEATAIGTDAGLEIRRRSGSKFAEYATAISKAIEVI